MRGVVIYVRYVCFPAIAILAVVWAVHIISGIAKSRRDKKNRK